MAFSSSDHSLDSVAHHLSVLAAKVDDIAQRAGVRAVDRSGLETTLAALPWPERRRLALVLESARVGTNSDALHAAVDVMLGLAADVWVRTPPRHERGSENPEA